jgi:hypothetical protein
LKKKIHTKDKSIAKRKVNTNFFPFEVLKNPPHLMFKKLIYTLKWLSEKTTIPWAPLLGLTLQPSHSPMHRPARWMDDIWTDFFFSLYSCPIANHGG